MAGIVPLLITATGHGSRQSGSFDIRTKHGRVQGISHRFCTPVHRSDGYSYKIGVRYGQESPSQAAS
jgi:hypothetical protein